MNEKKNFREIVDELTEAVFCHPGLRPRDKLVALVMLRHVNRGIYATTGELVTWIGVETTAEKTALCCRDVERARSALARAGLVEPMQRARKGQTARLRLALTWAVSGAASADTGVADTGVGTALQQPPESRGSADSSVQNQPTPESPKPFERTLGITLARAGARGSPHARGGAAAKLLAGHFTDFELKNWFGESHVEFPKGGEAIVWAPTQFQAGYIRTNFADRIRDALGVYQLDVLFGVPPGLRVQLPPPQPLAERRA